MCYWGQGGVAILCTYTASNVPNNISPTAIYASNNGTRPNGSGVITSTPSSAAISSRANPIKFLVDGVKYLASRDALEPTHVDWDKLDNVTRNNNTSEPEFDKYRDEYGVHWTKCDHVPVLWGPLAMAILCKYRRPLSLRKAVDTLSPQSCCIVSSFASDGISPAEARTTMPVSSSSLWHSGESPFLPSSTSRSIPPLIQPGEIVSPIQIAPILTRYFLAHASAGIWAGNSALKIRIISYGIRLDWNDWFSLDGWSTSPLVRG